MPFAVHYISLFAWPHDKLPQVCIQGTETNTQYIEYAMIYVHINFNWLLEGYGYGV